MYSFQDAKPLSGGALFARGFLKTVPGTIDKIVEARKEYQSLMKKEADKLEQRSYDKTLKEQESYFNLLKMGKEYELKRANDFEKQIISSFGKGAKLKVSQEEFQTKLNEIEQKAIRGENVLSDYTDLIENNLVFPEQKPKTTPKGPSIEAKIRSYSNTIKDLDKQIDDARMLGNDLLLKNLTTQKNRLLSEMDNLTAGIVGEPSLNPMNTPTQAKKAPGTKKVW